MSNILGIPSPTNRGPKNHPFYRPRNDLLCVEWDVKPYTLTH